LDSPKGARRVGGDGKRISPETAFNGTRVHLKVGTGSLKSCQTKKGELMSHVTEIKRKREGNAARAGKNHGVDLCPSWG